MALELLLLLLSNCLKGYTKGKLPVQGDTLTYNTNSHTKTITIKTAYTIQLQD